MVIEEFNLAQLRHAYSHLVNGRIKAAEAVLSSVIRSLETKPKKGDS